MLRFCNNFHVLENESFLNNIFEPSKVCSKEILYYSIKSHTMVP